MVKETPVRSIIEAIAGAAAAWSEPFFAARVRAREAVRERTGYPVPAIDFAFDQLFGALRRDRIAETIAGELGSVDVLDEFVEHQARRVRALPLGRVCVISSRTTVGVALVPAIFALCAKCEVLVKDREDALVAAFFSTLAEALPALRSAALARQWHGESDADTLEDFAAVVAFGADATLERIASRLHFPTRFIGYPAKTSAGYIARTALRSDAAALDVARSAARDMLLYDGEGCLSLQVLFVERDAPVSQERFAELLRASIGAVARELPAAASPGASAARALARESALFRGASNFVAVAGELDDTLILFDAAVDEPPPLLARTIAVRCVDDANEAAEYVARHRLALEALGIAGDGAEIARLAASSGAARIAPLGRLQQPPLRGYHGGRPRIAEFVRWIVDET